MSDRLTNILYVAVSIIAMFIELKENEFRLNVDLKNLTLVKVASRDFNCSISLTDFSLNCLKESDFRLSWEIVKDLFSIWVEVKLFCFVIILLLVNRTIDFELRMKFENQFACQLLGWFCSFMFFQESFDVDLIEWST